MSEISEDFTIYTDGACSGNPGVGGWGVIIFCNKKNTKMTIHGGEIDTTNNRMELQAVIKALEEVSTRLQSTTETKPSVALYTDSKYVQIGLQSWIVNWKKNGWKTSKKEDVKNRDLWEILDHTSSNINLILHHVKAHHTNQFNNEADSLAKLGKITLNTHIKKMHKE